MKTIFTLLSSLILCTAVLAAPIDKGARQKSTLTIRSSDRANIRVVIDGRRFEPGDNYLRIRSLDAGFHSVRIYKERNTGFFMILGSRYDLVFSNSVRIKPSTDMSIMIDRFGRATVKENSSNGYGGWNSDRGGFGGNDRGLNSDRSGGYSDNSDLNFDKTHDFDFDHSVNNGDYGTRDTKWDGNTGRGGRDDQSYNNSQGYGNNSNSRVMTDVEFNRVLASMQNEWYENNKMKSALQIVSSSFLTTVQVKQMIQLFGLEENKLSLAEQAYSKTVDQKNYFAINDVLSFSSRDALARYIRSH